jgi:hypothetical protein
MKITCINALHYKVSEHQEKKTSPCNLGEEGSERKMKQGHILRMKMRMDFSSSTITLEARKY